MQLRDNYEINSSVAVVIPIYKVDPSQEELFSIQHNFEKLNNFKIYIICPKNLDFSNYGKYIENAEKINLNKRNFRSLKTYNKLMLNKDFYNLFINYTYILIIQTDVLIFRNNLIEWCLKGYSYIGAPWMSGKIIYKYAFPGRWIINKLFPTLFMPIKTFVGNGGLSLRRIEDCIKILDKYWMIAKFWNSQEDYFWSYFYLLEDKYLIPGTMDASKFSLELDAQLLFELNGNIVPFGCHAYNKYMGELWKQFLQ